MTKVYEAKCKWGNSQKTATSAAMIIFVLSNTYENESNMCDGGCCGERSTVWPQKGSAVFLGNNISELSLTDALKLIEYLQDKLNSTVAAFGPVVIAAPGTAVEVPAIVGEKTEFDVVFERWGWMVLALLGVWRGLPEGGSGGVG
ncbi:hypothetical protein RJ640_014973 [Escallonia rubra]|uniref:Uncharacterized protein n=1 Tax=Escallonia rubra TaxID=112253 RepID=A0AA88QZX3_9ASTE|nr:hypothetical protein RJ640_014973 [Escallonia rubra]